MVNYDPNKTSQRNENLRPIGTKKLKPLEMLARLVLAMKGNTPPGVVHFTAWCVAVESYGYESDKVLKEMEERGIMKLAVTAETKTPMVVLTKEGMKL